MSLFKSINGISSLSDWLSGDRPGRWGGFRVNDIHSQLNATCVHAILRPTCLTQLTCQSHITPRHPQAILRFLDQATGRTA
jgi:hypothetical protein